jgi:protein gp37
MAAKSDIEWTDATWPVVQGCDYDSPGCIHCYAVSLIWRQIHHPNPKLSAPVQGLVEKRPNGTLVWTGKIAERHDRLDWPRQWKEPRKIFLPSHGDLFHEDVSVLFIDEVFDVMESCPHHTFQVLTKRSQRQRQFMNARYGKERRPPRNVWCGVSVEDRARRPRIADLQATDAAVRFISFEPLLEDLGELDLTGIDQAITGGESGPKKRPHDPDWQRSILRQCRAQGVAFFGKQWDKVQPLPADLMVREFPKVAV